jgi:hypothetical protein
MLFVTLRYAALSLECRSCADDPWHSDSTRARKETAKSGVHRLLVSVCPPTSAVASGEAVLPSDEVVCAVWSGSSTSSPLMRLRNALSGTAALVGGAARRNGLAFSLSSS